MKLLIMKTKSGGYRHEATTIYYTFSWDSDRVERVCFGIVCPEGKEQVPPHFHSSMKKFVKADYFIDDFKDYLRQVQEYQPNCKFL